MILNVIGSIVCEDCPVAVVAVAIFDDGIASLSICLISSISSGVSSSVSSRVGKVLELSEDRIISVGA